MKKFRELEINYVHSNALLDKVLKLAGLKNDAALSRALEVAPPVISKIRHGHLPVGASFAIRLYELTNISIAEIKGILTGKVTE